jgi:hypothetical protein
MTTGKYAMGSNEPLSTPSDWAESALKTDSTDVTKHSKGVEELGKWLLMHQRKLMLLLAVKGRGP